MRRTFAYGLKTVGAMVLSCVIAGGVSDPAFSPIADPARARIFKRCIA